MKAYESCSCGAEIALDGKGEYRIVSELEDFRIAHNLCRTGRVAERANAPRLKDRDDVMPCTDDATCGCGLPLDHDGECRDGQ